MMELYLALAKAPSWVAHSSPEKTFKVCIDYLDDGLYLFERAHKNPLLAISGKPALKTQ